jgi:uncharacterized membrane protein
MKLAAAYLAALVTMVVADAVMLSAVIRPIFEREMPGLLAENPDWAAALVFYLVYPAGVVRFAAMPAWRRATTARAALGAAAREGALLGGFAYATFELTGMAVIAGWTWTVVVADIAWGGLLTAAVAAAAVAGTRAAGGAPR